MSNLQPKPTPGFQYKVIRGDSLNNIERSAYGYITGNLESANPFLLTRGISLENRPFIYVDDILNIPTSPDIQALKTEQAKKQLERKQDEEITLIINDREVKFQSIRIIRTMDTASDGWTATIQRVPGEDPELDALLIPYSFFPAQVYIGNELIVNGILYGVAPDSSGDGKKVVLEGFSYTADVVDSTMPKPYQAEKITLLDRANQLLSNIGIRAELDDGVTADGAFDRVTGEVTDTIFNHLLSLATQKGLLVSSTPEGNLLFTKTTDKPTVGTIETDTPITMTMGAKFDGRLLYNQVTAIGESPGSPTKKSTVTDENVPRSRFITIKSDDVSDGEIERSAEWRRTKQFADALTIPFPVEGFYAPNRLLWTQNSIVTVKAPDIFVNDGFDFLIRQVEYAKENSGNTCILSLVPPEVYTGERIVLPWQAV